MTTLSHLTMTTGHISRSTRADVDPEVIDRLAGVLDTGGGPIPGLDEQYLMVLRPGPGSAFFQVAAEPGRSPTPSVLCFAAWEPGDSAPAWRAAVRHYEAMAPNGGFPPAPQGPPPVPWLATYFGPGIAVTDFTMIQMLGDLERCVFWALAEP